MESTDWDRGLDIDFSNHYQGKFTVDQCPLEITSKEKCKNFSGGPMSVVLIRNSGLKELIGFGTTPLYITPLPIKFTRDYTHLNAETQQAVGKWFSLSPGGICCNHHTIFVKKLHKLIKILDKLNSFDKFRSMTYIHTTNCSKINFEQSGKIKNSDGKEIFKNIIDFFFGKCLAKFTGSRFDPVRSLVQIFNI